MEVVVKGTNGCTRFAKNEAIYNQRNETGTRSAHFKALGMRRQHHAAGRLRFAGMEAVQRVTPLRRVNVGPRVPFEAVVLCEEFLKLFQARGHFL